MNTVHMARVGDLIVEDVGEEALIYDTRTDTAHSLNSVAAAVWRAAHDGATVSQLVEHTSADEDLVVIALSELHEKGLMDGSEFAAPRISRRRALGRMAAVGAAAAAAPFIVSATVPKAEAAGSPPSCRAVGQTCTGTTFASNNCCSSTSCGNNSPVCSTSGTCTCCTPAGTKPGGSNCSASNAYMCCSGRCATTGQACGT